MLREPRPNPRSEGCSRCPAKYEPTHYKWRRVRTRIVKVAQTKPRDCSEESDNYPSEHGPLDRVRAFLRHTLLQERQPSCLPRTVVPLYGRWIREPRTRIALCVNGRRYE